ncbi:MAG: hypothetical protein GY847_14215 [Proteobacteria bacterium]|nr:hypothetical protein [Pseudomonadota bacterium]
MAASIKEQIIQNVLTTLATITTGNGYAQSVGTVAREGTISGIAKWPALLVEDQNETIDTTVTMSWTHAELPIVIDIFTGGSETPETTASYLEADIHKALLVDHTRGGLAIDTLPISAELMSADKKAKPTSGTQVGFTINYRYAYGDPYTAAP